MYTEEVIFGPLTFKQLIGGLIGLGIAKLIVTYNTSPVAYIVAGGFCVLGFVYVVRNVPKKIKLKDVTSYLLNKKLTMGEQEYLKMLNVKIAQQASYVEMRRQKGLRIDQEGNDLLVILKELRGEEK